MYLPLIVASCALAQFDSRHCHMSSPRRQPLQPLITNQREPSTTAATTKPSKSAKKKPRSDENELFENRAGALLHRVLREKQMLLSRIRAQAFALEQATVQARHLESRALSPRHTLTTEQHCPMLTFEPCRVPPIQPPAACKAKGWLSRPCTVRGG